MDHSESPAFTDGKITMRSRLSLAGSSVINLIYHVSPTRGDYYGVILVEYSKVMSPSLSNLRVVMSAVVIC